MSAGESDLQREGRLLITDHEHFVLFNVYAPNAGERPERARLGFKLRWFTALRDKLDSYGAQGRPVLVCGDLNIPCNKQDVNRDLVWDGMYTPQEYTPRGILYCNYDCLYLYYFPSEPHIEVLKYVWVDAI
jgi:exonuclease III